MAGRTSQRNIRAPSRYEDGTDLNILDTQLGLEESGRVPGVGGAGSGRPITGERVPAAGGSGSGRPLEQGNLSNNQIIQQENQQNDDQEVIGAEQNTAEELIELEGTLVEGELSNRDLGVAVEGLREEMSNFMANAITTFGALFSALAGPKLDEITNTNDLGTNDILRKGIEQAKSVAAIRAVRYKDAVLRNERQRNGPESSETPNTNDQVGQRTPHNNSRPTTSRNNINNNIDSNNSANNNIIDSNNSTNNIINNETALTNAVTQQPGVRPNQGGAPVVGTLPNVRPNQDEVDRTSEQQRIWKKIVDERRKNNIIIMGLTETGIREEDEEAVRHLLGYLQCGNRIKQITNMRRLGNRTSKRRLILVNFNNEFAVKQILDRSPKLSSSALFARVHIKKDLPFEERPVYIRND
ncbi:unnamed protein product, partial [Meganyctiphanes norvegica]